MKPTAEDYFIAGPNRLFYRYYCVSGASRCCLILHGHGEHSGRYEKMQTVLEGEGISMAIFEYRGQGRSEGQDVYIDSFADYIEDVSRFLLFLEKKFDWKEPFILLGHSLGGLVALYWAQRFPDKVKAMILSSPCLGLKVPGFLVGLNHIFNRIVPKMIYSNPVYPPHLTHNREEMETYKKDPYIKRKISVRLVHEMILYGQQLDALEKLQFSFPVYMLTAGLEKVVDGERSRRFFDKLVVPDKRAKLFEGFYHELFHELEQDKAFDTLRDYLSLIK